MIKSAQRKTESVPDHMNFRAGRHNHLMSHRTLIQLLGAGINSVLAESRNFPGTAFMKKFDLILWSFEKDNRTIYQHYSLTVGTMKTGMHKKVKNF